jgi:hypothetical protein
MADRRCCWLACAGVLALLSGCVERRFVIESSPPGAKVFVNNREVGSTPADYPFTYYGTYLITLEMDGFQTRTIEQHVSPTWYSYPPLDFIFENLYPLKLSDIRRLPDENGPYILTPVQRPNEVQLRYDAEELRKYAKENIPPPSKPVLPTSSNPANQVDPRAAVNQPQR